MSQKRHNKSSFNEKLIHQYIVRGLNLKRKAVINLLPEDLKGKPINYVLHESPSSDVRFDIKVVFKNREKPLDIEIKWKFEDLKKNHSQFRRLNNLSGLLIALGGDKLKTKDSNITQSMIDTEDFQDWLSCSISQLWYDTLIGKGLSTRHKSWILVLRGKYGENWEKMEIAKKKGKEFWWGFQNQASTYENISNIAVGDTLFILELKVGAKNAQGGVNETHRKLSHAKKLTKYKITKAPYIELSDKFGSTFEKSTLGLHLRKYVHFIGFIDATKNKIKTTISEFDQDMKKLTHNSWPWPAIKSSINLGRGSPSALTPSEADTLADIMQLQSRPKV